MFGIQKTACIATRHLDIDPEPTAERVDDRPQGLDSVRSDPAGLEIGQHRPGYAEPRRHVALPQAAAVAHRPQASPDDVVEHDGST